MLHLQSPGDFVENKATKSFFVEVLDKVKDADLRRDVIRRTEERIGMDAIEQQLTGVDA